ncbi:MAG: hypothetical protein GXC73_12795 [Chitinophagaceae bacterium]|nr:hypothetical protein [Chitinophagaceae bacterium]
MKKITVTTVICFFIVLLLSVGKKTDPYFQFHENLSEYGFFQGDLKQLQPSAGIIPYDLNTPLFSDYAEKLRFIKLPAGKKVSYSASNIFDMPLGTVLIKNFYFYKDVRKPELGRRIIETRLLAHMQDGWHTYQYIWNDEQTEAVFEPIGDVTTVEYIDAAGKKIKSKYVVPNQPQCKGCHSRRDTIVPIGIAARHLNGDYAYASGTQNQLQYWQQQNMIDLPSTNIPANAIWNDEKSGSLNDRARAYLDINCGHCHNPMGPASTSGLFLDIHTSNPTSLGILKTPVAAGRGSGGLKYAIEPGKPNQSFMIYRMNSIDVGVAMPELGRNRIHKEGVALISKWIKELEKN